MFRHRLLVAIFICSVFLPVKAEFLLSGSRVIYNERDGEASVLVRQLGDVPSLMQVWLSDAQSISGQELTGNSLPFLLVPSVARLEGGRGQSVRILRTGGGLPEDRESLFWLNVVEIPPKPTPEADENLLQFSSGAAMKFFYRPRGLRGPPDKAHQALRFSLDSRQDDGFVWLRIRNPSPYHVTFDSLELRSGGRAVLAEMKPQVLARMVEPMGELVIPLEMVAATGRQSLSGARIHYGVINDYGATIEGQSGFN